MASILVNNKSNQDVNRGLPLRRRYRLRQRAIMCLMVTLNVHDIIMLLGLLCPIER